MNKPEWHKRINVLIIVFVLLVIGLNYRLLQKSILEHQSYAALAQNQHVVKKNLPANRGKIYSSDLFPLATNSRDWQVMVVPNQVPEDARQNMATLLAPFVEKSAAEVYEKINNEKSYIPPLIKHLSEYQANKINELNLKGVFVTPVSIRFYPEGPLASQILGFVDAEAEGKYGLEGYFNDELKGISGEVYGAKDSRGRVFNINLEVNPHNGKDAYLTIDRNVQNKAEEIITAAVEKYQSDSGSIIVMDPNTGKIIAMTNSPTFNPNEYNKVASDAQNVFNNMAINNAWEPGSIFKPLIMAAAINEGKVTPDTQEVFASSIEVDGFTIKTSTGQAYGKETMTQVLENSDNVAMVWISELLGKETMYKYLKDFGFSRKTGIELNTESPGDIPELKTWSNTLRATASFGQGITATPLQILNATNAIANGGKILQPYIVSKLVDYNGKEEVRQPKVVNQVLTKDAAQKTAGMMVSVVDYGHGKKAGVPGFKVAGKTGTAQVARPGGGYYDSRHVGSFVGFAPADNPKFSMIVRLDNPKNVDWAESSAAPTFGEMAKWLIEYYKLTPDPKLLDK